jgi:TolB-like protein
VRIAVVYAAVAWLVLQLGAIVFPALHAPDWAMSLLIGFVALGFPVALVLAWAFEMTPEGVRRTRPADVASARSPEAHRGAGRFLNGVIIVALLAAVAVLGWRQFALQRSPMKADSTATGTTLGKSIAVLPFENLSGDKNNAYFAAGMQDLILTRLAEIGDLKVISRTSTQQFDSHPDDLKKIGRELGVATILEGSVQKAGSQVLINVQLIDARSDSHIWAKSYTRTLDNIFGVEGEVAQEVADELQSKLTAPEKQRLATAPTTNADAYDAYLRARAVSVVSTANNREAAAGYRQAVKLDPTFGLAWAGLAYAEENLYASHFGDRNESLVTARRALDKARALVPDAAQTLLALGNFRMVTRQDFQGALAACGKARANAPSDPNVLWCITNANWALGRRQEVLDLARRAVALDPLNPGTLNVAGNYYFLMRDYSTALKLADRAQALNPKDTDAFGGKAAIYLAEGRLKDAEEALAEARASLSGVATEGLANLAWRIKFVARDYAGAVAVVRPLLKSSSPINLDYRVIFWNWLGLAFQRAGKGAGAHEAFEHAVAAAHRLLARKDNSDQAARAAYHIFLGMAEAGLGHRHAALEAANQAVALVPTSRNAAFGPVMEAERAWIEAKVGDRDAAIAALPRLLRIASPDLVSVPLLKLDPMWDPLRKDPRFQALIAKHADTSSAADKVAGS